MINWEEFASLNNLTPEEFQKEILTVAACIGATLIDEGLTGDADTLKFTCSDNIGKIAVYVKRLND